MATRRILSESLAKHQYFPKTTTDLICMGFTVVALPTVIVYGWSFLLPSVVLTTSKWYFYNVALMLFLWVNVVLNFYKAVTEDVSTRRLTLLNAAQEGWVYCQWCKGHAPPRSHHCPICDVCVLRRDHHCYFTGRCVGLHNHRYFIMFMLYASLGCLYGFVLSVMYIIQEEGGFTFRIPFALILPVLAKMSGQMPVHMFISFMSSCSAGAGFISASFLVIQLMLFLKGQTFHELRRGLANYNRGFLNNLEELLGKYWWVSWIFPLIPSPLPLDGSSYTPLEVSDSKHSSEDGRHFSATKEGTRKRFH